MPAALPGELVVGDDLNLLAEQLVDQARADGVALTGEDGLLPQLIARVLETGLQLEMTEHLGYERHDPEGNGSGNSRNGTFAKTVTTEVGEVDIAVPRDRNATFDPVLVPHGERRVDGVASQVISLYGQGLTTGEIRDHLEETFGTQISKDTISRITDGIVADMEAWQSRPLDPIYAVVLIDAGRPMGRIAAAGDNAAMESFYSLLQKNVLNRNTRWETRDQLHGEIVHWIEHTYNRRRRQRALGRLTPIEFELAFTQPAAHAA